MRVQPVANTYPQLLTRSNSMLSSGITHILCAASYDAFPQAYHPGELALAQPVYCGQGKAAVFLFSDAKSCSPPLAMPLQSSSRRALCPK